MRAQRKIETAPRLVSRPYDPGEDAVLLHGAVTGRGFASMAREIDRSEKSVRERIRALRTKGFLPANDPRPAAVDDQPDAPVGMGAPIILHNDRELVRSTRAEGGFPRALAVNGRTFWVNGNGEQWQHTPEGAAQ